MLKEHHYLLSYLRLSRLPASAPTKVGRPGKVRISIKLIKISFKYGGKLVERLDEKKEEIIAKNHVQR